jgi:hypothetical protein
MYLSLYSIISIRLPRRPHGLPHDSPPRLPRLTRLPRRGVCAPPCGGPLRAPHEAAPGVLGRLTRRDHDVLRQQASWGWPLPSPPQCRRCRRRPLVRPGGNRAHQARSLRPHIVGLGRACGGKSAVLGGQICGRWAPSRWSQQALGRRRVDRKAATRSRTHGSRRCYLAEGPATRTMS